MQIDDSVITNICMQTNGHPFYTQHLCHAVWELCEPGDSVDKSMVERAIDLLLEREGYAYTSLWDTFSLNQRRLLIGLAQEHTVDEIFGSSFAKLYHLNSPSSVQRTVDNLLVRDIIDRDGSTYFISDRFFRIWIQRNSQN